MKAGRLIPEASADRLLALLKREGLLWDGNFYTVALFYARLRGAGDGELEVKLVHGKVRVRGAVYLCSPPGA